MNACLVVGVEFSKGQKIGVHGLFQHETEELSLVFIFHLHYGVGAREGQNSEKSDYSKGSQALNNSNN